MLNDVPMKPVFPFISHPRELLLLKDGSLAIIEFKERPVLEKHLLRGQILRAESFGDGGLSVVRADRKVIKF